MSQNLFPLKGKSTEWVKHANSEILMNLVITSSLRTSNEKCGKWRNRKWKEKGTKGANEENGQVGEISEGYELRVVLLCYAETFLALHVENQYHCFGPVSKL